MRSSTITPAPPLSACAWRAGAGFTMSKTRKSRNASTATGIVTGTSSTDSVIPATSSMTIAPGSLVPSARSACSAAHVPISVKTTNNKMMLVRESASSQSATMVIALATVPGAIGAKPTPPMVATASATRSSGAGRSDAVCNELVAFDLDDAGAREFSRRELGPMSQIDDTVDLGRLSRRPAFPGERRILARSVHEHVDDGADELGVAIERCRVMLILHGGRTLGGGVRIDLAGERR